MDSATWARLRNVAIGAARRAGASDAWVEDIADEAITRLVEQDEQPENAEAWLETVTKRLAYEGYRKQPADGWGKMPMTNPDAALGEKHYPPHLLNSSPSAGVLRRMQVRDVLGRLSRAEARMLRMQARGMTIKEIAAELGYTEGSVRTKISAARAKARDQSSNPDDSDS